VQGAAKLGPICCDEHGAGLGNGGREGSDHVIAGAVDPMCVLQDEDGASALGAHHARHHLHQPVSTAVDTELRRSIAFGDAHRVEKHWGVGRFRGQRVTLRGDPGTRFRWSQAIDVEERPQSACQCTERDSGGVGFATRNHDSGVAGRRVFRELVRQ
jgi:hypothetical protein